MLTLEDLGVLRGVSVDGGTVEVAITPTYSGCPAMADDARRPGAARWPTPGSPTSGSGSSCRPAWSTDWITERGRRALAEHGISAARAGTAPAGPVPLTLRPAAADRPLPAVRLGPAPS